jgi:hypothetical protein
MAEYTLGLAVPLNVTMLVNDFAAIAVYGKMSPLAVVMLLMEIVV